MLQKFRCDYLEKMTRVSNDVGVNVSVNGSLTVRRNIVERENPESCTKSVVEVQGHAVCTEPHHGT